MAVILTVTTMYYRRKLKKLSASQAKNNSSSAPTSSTNNDAKEFKKKKKKVNILIDIPSKTKPNLSTCKCNIYDKGLPTFSFCVPLHCKEKERAFLCK